MSNKSSSSENLNIKVRFSREDIWKRGWHVGDILDTRLGGGNFGQMINKCLRHHKFYIAFVHIVEVAKSNFGADNV